MFNTKLLPPILALTFTLTSAATPVIAQSATGGGKETLVTSKQAKQTSVKVDVNSTKKIDVNLIREQELQPNIEQNIGNFREKLTQALRAKGINTSQINFIETPTVERVRLHPEFNNPGERGPGSDLGCNRDREGEPASQKDRWEVFRATEHGFDAMPAYKKVESDGEVSFNEWVCYSYHPSNDDNAVYEFIFDIDYVLGPGLDKVSIVLTGSETEYGLIGGELITLEEGSGGNTFATLERSYIYKFDDIKYYSEYHYAHQKHMLGQKTVSGRMKVLSKKDWIKVYFNDKLIISAPTHPIGYSGMGYGFAARGTPVNCKDRYIPCPDHPGSFHSKNQFYKIVERSLGGAIDLTNWKNNSQKVIVHATNSTYGTSQQENILDPISNKILRDNAHYIGWGGTTNQKQLETLLEKSDGKGFVQTEDFDANIEATAEYIANLINNNKKTNSNIFEIGDQINFTVTPEEVRSNTTDNEYPNGKWSFIFEPTLESSPPNVVDEGKYFDEIPDSQKFMRPGKYTLKYGKEPVKQFTVHSKPIADFNVILTDKTDGNTKNISYQENSFDPDFKTQTDKGVVQKEWSYRDSTTGQFTVVTDESKLPSTLDKTYQIRLRVKDSQGSWSPYTVKLLSPTIAEPVVDFSFEHDVFYEYETQNIKNNSYTTNGTPILSYRWELKKDDNIVQTYDTETIPSIDFSNPKYGAGEYTLSLTINANGKESTSAKKFTVKADNVAPTFSIPEKWTIEVDKEAKLPITVSDNSGTQTTVTVADETSLPKGMQLTKEGDNWYLTGTPTSAGEYHFTLQATDKSNNTTKITRKIVVEDSANPKIIISPIIELEGESSQVKFIVNAKSTEATFNPTYSAQNLPSWLTLNPKTGEVYGKTIGVQAGDYQITWEVDDNNGNKNTKKSIIRVKQKPQPDRPGYYSPSTNAQNSPNNSNNNNDGNSNSEGSYALIIGGRPYDSNGNPINKNNSEKEGNDNSNNSSKKDSKNANSSDDKEKRPSNGDTSGISLIKNDGTIVIKSKGSIPVITKKGTTVKISDNDKNKGFYTTIHPDGITYITPSKNLLPGVYNIKLLATEKNGSAITVNLTIETLGKTQSNLKRLGGATRVETAVKISQDLYPNGNIDNIVLARSDIFADAVAGTPYAKKHNAPVLLTPSSVLHETTKNELLRLRKKDGKTTIHIMGGKSAISLETEQKIKNLGFNTIRVDGQNRFDTARKIHGNLGSPSQIAIVDGGDQSLSIVAGTAMSKIGGSILFSSDGKIPVETQKPLQNTGKIYSYLNNSNVIASHTIVGGKNIPVYHIEGNDPQQMSMQTDRLFFQDVDTIVTSHIERPIDAVVGGTYAAHKGVSLILTGNSLDETLDWAVQNGKKNVVIIGGEKAVPEK